MAPEYVTAWKRDVNPTATENITSTFLKLKPLLNDLMLIYKYQKKKIYNPKNKMESIFGSISTPARYKIFPTAGDKNPKPKKCMIFQILHFYCIF